MDNRLHNDCDGGHCVACRYDEEIEMSLDHHFELLGYKVKDKVTRLEGVVTSICFDLYGCVQADFRPQGSKPDGMPKDGLWMDLSRLEKISDEPVMALPDFEKPKQERFLDNVGGPSDKPRK